MFIIQILEITQKKRQPNRKKKKKKVKLQLTRRREIVKKKKGGGAGIQTDRYVESWDYKREKNYAFENDAY